jgi:transposase-like protein
MIKIIKRKVKKCPYCGSLKTIKKGKRKDIKKPITRYFCKDCNK